MATDRQKEQAARILQERIKNRMQYLTKDPEIVDGADVKFRNNKYLLHPENREGRVGKYGIDGRLKYLQVLDLCHRNGLRPDAIVKAGGPRAKWYLKRCARGDIESEIKKSRRASDGVRRYTLYIVEWRE